MTRIGGGIGALCVSIAVIVAACESSESESAIDENKRVSDLSDAELDRLCAQEVERRSADPGVIRLFCLIKSSFLDADSCHAAFDYCVHGPVPEAQIVCAHVPAQNITCTATVGQLSCDEHSDESIEDRLNRTTCEDLQNNWQYLGGSASLGGPCGTPSNCALLWAFDVVGLTGVPRYDAGTDEP
jgi:hypothetical protein